MSVLSEIKHFFLADPAKVGAQRITPREIVETVRAESQPPTEPSPLAQMAADLLAIEAERTRATLSARKDKAP